MKKWNKEKAIEAIQKIIDAIPGVTLSGRASENHARWVSNTLRIIEEIFGRESRYYATLSNYTWSFQGQKIYRGWDDPDIVIARYNETAFQEQIKQARGILLSAIDHLLSSEIEDVFQRNKHQEISEIVKIINLGTTKLRKLIRKPPTSERDVQDKYEDLLTAQDIEYSREYPHIKYSSKQYVPDFSFEHINLAVEIKLCKNSGDEKSFIAQINDDILAYKTKFENIIFLIYDVGQIRNEDTFKASFESNSNVIIQIIKH